MYLSYQGMYKTGKKLYLALPSSVFTEFFVLIRYGILAGRTTQFANCPRLAKLANWRGGVCIDTMRCT